MVAFRIILTLFMVLAYAIPVRAQETITILAFGDSLTQGYGLPEADGLVPQLQAWLGNGVELVNAGVSGDTTAGGVARIDWMLTDDVDGVIVALGGNDLLRGLSPAESRANLDGILAVITAHELPVMLVGFAAPLNYGPEYKAEFDAIYPELAEKYGAVFYPYYFDGFGVGEDTVAMMKFMQNDATHPNATGVGMIVAAIGPTVRELIAATKP